MYQLSISVHYLIYFWHKITRDYQYRTQKHPGLASAQSGKTFGGLCDAASWILRLKINLNFDFTLAC
jgi:hypothetical protein